MKRKMEKMQVKVKRAQSYAGIRDGGSYNYKYSPAPPALQSDDFVWSVARVNIYEARDKFLSFVRAGRAPDFSQEIANVSAWLSDHGHKKSDSNWRGTVETYENALSFLCGGYKDVAAQFVPVTVEYEVETLPPYSLGSFNDVGDQKWMPINKGEKFVHTEEGYIWNKP